MLYFFLLGVSWATGIKRVRSPLYFWNKLLNCLIERMVIVRIIKCSTRLKIPFKQPN
jgi:hypothetical protein